MVTTKHTFNIQLLIIINTFINSYYKILLIKFRCLTAFFFNTKLHTYV